MTSEQSIRKACVENGFSYAAWPTCEGPLRSAILALARRIEAGGEVVAERQPIQFRHARVSGRTIDEMRARLPADLYAQGDCVLIWASEADLCNLSVAHFAHAPDTARIAELEAALVEHNDLMRSILAVVQRRGEQTDWLPLRGQVKAILHKYHDTATTARQALKGSPDA
jgi:hypothetical protein